MIKISVLVEDSIMNRSRLEGEKGLSLYIEGLSQKVLFDTGMTNKFIGNAIKMGINLHKTDFVILSHGHCDHTGGFMYFVEEYGDDFTLLIRPELYTRKYKDDGAGIEFIGNSFSKEDVENSGFKIQYVKEGINKISENLYIFSSSEIYNNQNSINNRYTLQNQDGYESDKFLDEIVLVADTVWGAIIITGCSHNGIANLARTVSEAMNKSIYAIVGGIHLNSASEEVIIDTIKELNAMNVKRIALCHCSGNKTIKLLNESFEGDVIGIKTGSVIEL